MVRALAIGFVAVFSMLPVYGSAEEIRLEVRGTTFLYESPDSLCVPEPNSFISRRIAELQKIIPSQTNQRVDCGGGYFTKGGNHVYQTAWVGYEANRTWDAQLADETFERELRRIYTTSLREVMELHKDQNDKLTNDVRSVTGKEINPGATFIYSVEPLIVAQMSSVMSDGEELNTVTLLTMRVLKNEPIYFYIALPLEVQKYTIEQGAKQLVDMARSLRFE